MLNDLDLRVLFVVNGNIQIGYGHISRVKSIALEFFKDQITCLCLTKTDNSFIDDIAASFEEYILVDSFEKPLDRKKITECIENNSINCLIIDLLEAEYRELEWLRILQPNILICSVSLFDFGIENRYEDVCIFPSYIDSHTYEVCNRGSKTLVFEGKDYLVFNSILLKKSRNKYSEFDILISMGGTDPAGISLKVLQSLLNESLNIKIVLSKISESFLLIKDIVKGKEHIELIPFTDDFPALMKASKLMVLNGGITRYEACLIKKPFIAISLHEKQFFITKKLTDLGVGINLGVYDELTKEQIKDTIIQLFYSEKQRQEMIRCMEGIVDDLGARRIFNIIKSFANEKNV